MQLQRPMLKPGLRRVWRGPDTLQLGIDVPRPLVLQPVDDGVEHWLRGLDGRLRLTELLDLAPTAGLTEPEARLLLDRLADAGLLTDGALPDQVLAGLPLDLRDRIRPDLTAAALHDPRPDAAVVALQGRRALHVAVLSDDPVGTLLAERLTEAGVGRVDEVTGLELPGARPGAPNLLVVPSSTARSRRRDLAESSTPHLVTEVGETLVRLGPLVLPGRSACFGCLEQGRLDRDRGWAPVSAQLAASPVPPGRTPLVHAAAALAALHLLDWCAGGVPPEVEGVVEVGLPHGRAVRRACPPHPGCGCTWPSGTRHVTMTG